MKLTEPWFPGYETVILSAGGSRLYWGRRRSLRMRGSERESYLASPINMVSGELLVRN